MASAVTKPVTAALGLLPTVLRQARRLPTRAVQLPILALSAALNGVDAAKREYEKLSERGEQVVGGWRAGPRPDLPEPVKRLASAAPVVGLVDRATEAAADTSGTVAHAAGRVAGKARQGLHEAADRVDNLAQQVAGESSAAIPAPAGAPVASPTPTSGTARHDTAATPDVVRLVEQVAASTSVPKSAADLPLADYDHMTLGSLRGRLRSLNVEQLSQLRAYEKSKADRLPVVTMLDNRIAKLAAGDAAPAAAPLSPVSASAPSRPPKQVGTATSAQSDTSPPRSKVRST